MMKSLMLLVIGFNAVAALAGSPEGEFPKEPCTWEDLKIECKLSEGSAKEGYIEHTTRLEKQVSSGNLAAGIVGTRLKGLVATMEVVKTGDLSIVIMDKRHGLFSWNTSPIVAGKEYYFYVSNPDKRLAPTATLKCVVSESK